MLKSKYRTFFAAGVAAVLAGAVLFSPLLCGMPCLEAGVEKTITAAEAEPAAGEFMGQFAESGVVGCVLTQVVLSIDWSDWADTVQAGTWVGFKAVRLMVVSQFESRDWETDLWLTVIQTMRRGDSVQSHLRATSAQTILNNVEGRFAAWQNLSTD